jgi:hypothetical protein
MEKFQENQFPEQQMKVAVALPPSTNTKIPMHRAQCKHLFDPSIFSMILHTRTDGKHFDKIDVFGDDNRNEMF